MPRIFLKPNSAEYADENQKKKQTTKCEMPGCTMDADHKAPKDRSLGEYYAFCLEHVQDYNKAWNFFAGMADPDIEEHMTQSFYGDRPTWRYDNYTNLESDLYNKAWQTYNNMESEPSEQQTPPFERHSPEYEAMAIMGLEPPLTLEIIKKRYKELAKKHHPDLNGHNPESEELLKRVNMSYTILKLAYNKFEKTET